MSIKRRINDLAARAGYQIERLPSVSRDLALGRYRWLEQRGINTILDVGANKGQFARKIRQILPGAAIYSFEPLASCFEELSAAAKSLAPMQCFPFALGKDHASVTMQKNAYTPSSSILPITKRTMDAFPHTRRVTDERVDVRTLDEVAAALTLKPKVLLKIDVQGYELNVLAGAERTLAAVDTILIEASFVELYETQPLFHDVYQFLHERRFTYSGNFDQLSDPATGAVLQADAIFLNARA